MKSQTAVMQQAHRVTKEMNTDQKTSSTIELFRKKKLTNTQGIHAY